MSSATSSWRRSAAHRRHRLLVHRRSSDRFEVVRRTVDRAGRDDLRAQRPLVLGHGPLLGARERGAVLRRLPVPRRTPAPPARPRSRGHRDPVRSGAPDVACGCHRLGLGPPSGGQRLGARRRGADCVPPGARLQRAPDERGRVPPGRDAGAVAGGAHDRAPFAQRDRQGSSPRSCSRRPRASRASSSSRCSSPPPSSRRCSPATPT